MKSVTVILPGGGKYSFNGAHVRLPGGVREIQVQPGRGSRNITTAAPASPITAAPKTIPMPAKQRLRLGRVSLKTGPNFIVEDAINQLALYESQIAIQAELMGLWVAQIGQDAEICEQTLAQTQASLDGFRARVATKTKKTKKREGSRRMVIHGFTRRKKL